MMRWKRLGAALSVVAVVAAGVPAIALEPTKRVDMSVLLVAQDATVESAEAWKSILDREGTPYRVVVAAEDGELTAADLEVGEGHARYQAVICAPDCLIPELSDAEKALLADFQKSYGIRRINAYAWPQPALGLDWGGTGGPADGQAVGLTTAGQAEFPDLTGSFALDAGTWAYPSTPAVGALYTSLIEDGTGRTLAGIHSNGAGYEEMNISWASNPWQLQTFAVGHGALTWVTGGTYLGYSRNYFTMHIDDVFLPDDRWSMTTNRTPEPSPDPIRMVPDDVTRAIAWQGANGLVMDFVFNGAGSIEAGGPEVDALTDALLANKDQFRWINHTYTHQNLQAVSEETILDEITLNAEWAASVGLAHNPAELVTGEHSGLATVSEPMNPALPAALTAAGIRWIASDNSVDPTSYAVGSARTVPRYPSNVYYNVGTVAEQLDEYNYIYYENCINTPVTTCLTSPAAWEDYVDSEARIMLPHLLGNDPKPHYFHQSNLAEDGTLYYVVDEVLSRYRALTTLPLVQPTFSDAGEAMLRMETWRAQRDQLTAYLEGGAVYLGAPDGVAVEVPVTGSPTVGEEYGTQRSGWVLVNGPVATTTTSTTTTSSTTSTSVPPTTTTSSTTSTSVPPITTTTVISPPTTTPSTGGGPSVGGITVGPGRFVDDDGHPHEWAIERLAALGITDGCATNRFCPDKPVIRGEAAVLLWRALGGSGEASGGMFADVAGGEWFAPAAGWLRTRGIVAGYGDGTFRATAPLSRAEGAVMLAQGFALGDGTGGGFADVSSSAWYFSGVSRLAATAATQGCHLEPARYCPEEPLTRADLAAMLARLLER